jgi:hypothetical protein
MLFVSVSSFLPSYFYSCLREVSSSVLPPLSLFHLQWYQLYVDYIWYGQSSLAAVGPGAATLIDTTQKMSSKLTYED